MTCGAPVEDTGANHRFDDQLMEIVKL